MTVKAVLDSLDGVAESLKPEYKQGDDKRFYLDLDGVDGHHAVGALKRAKDHEKTSRTKAEEEVKQARAALEALQEQMDERLRGALPKADVAQLETSWKTKLEKANTESQSKLDTLNRSLRKVLVDNEAQRLAAKLAASPEMIPLLLPHITSRLAVEIDGDTAVTRVLGTDGKPSALTLDELGKEFVGNKAFAAVIAGTRASGGGAEGGGGGSPDTKVDFSKDPKAIAAAMRARNPKLSRPGA